MYLNRSSYHRAATMPERNALFNGCGVVSIVRDADDSGRLVWQVYYGTELGEGFRAFGDFRTMGAALSESRKSFPNLPIWRVFLARVEGEKRPRPLHLDSCPLSDLPDKESAGLVYSGNDSDGQSQFAPAPMLQLDSQDIESALAYADARAMAWHGIAPGNVTGVYEIPEIGDNGQWQDIAALYVTESSRPFDLSAIYRRAF